MVREPFRPVTDEALDGTVTPMVALPEPVVALKGAQAASLDAVHAQLDPVAVIPIRPVPPADP